MNSIVLSVGTELLLGQILNTNERFISEELQKLGVGVIYRGVVGDNAERLEKLVRISAENADLIIISGGLGPTEDDLTKETVAKALGIELVFNEYCMKSIEEAFKSYNISMSENNVKQAYIPKGAVVLENKQGTAPGFFLETEFNKKNIMVAVLPGPPREMESMFRSALSPELKKKTNANIYYKNLRLIGIGESQLETDLIELISNQTDPTIATYAKDGECSVRVTSMKEHMEDAVESVNNMVDKIDKLVGRYIYSYDDKDLIEVVAEKLFNKNLTISTAESCTGGMLGSAFTDIPDISKVYDGGFITYSNRAKIEELNVNQVTLDKHGAVSPEVACEMADGARKNRNTDIGVSITGIAGPGGGSVEKPVGLAYVGISSKDGVKSFKLKVKDYGRKYIKHRFLLLILMHLNDELEKL